MTVFAGCDFLLATGRRGGDEWDVIPDDLSLGWRVAFRDDETGEVLYLEGKLGREVDAKSAARALAAAGIETVEQCLDAGPAVVFRIIAESLAW